MHPGKNKYPINGLLPLSNKFLASKLTKFQIQIFIHLIPVTIYIYFKSSKYLWVMFQNFDFSANLLSYTCIYDLQKLSEEFSFLCYEERNVLECIVHNILLILIMRIQILLSSFLNTAKNANVNSIYLFPIYKYANNVI